MSTPQNAKKEDFHRERSHFLDAFATLEEAMLIHAKVATLDKKSNDLLKSLRDIRNDLVHSRFQFVNLDGGLRAIAINSQSAREVARSGRVLAIDEFKVLKSRINDLKKNLG